MGLERFDERVEPRPRRDGAAQQGDAGFRGVEIVSCGAGRNQLAQAPDCEGPSAVGVEIDHDGRSCGGGEADGGEHMENRVD